MVTEQSFSKIQEALKNIDSLRTGNRFEKVVEENDNYLSSQGGESQGEYDTITEVYKIDENVYIKLVLHTDSYGDNESIVSIQIVKPFIKQVQDFVEI